MVNVKQEKVIKAGVICFILAILTLTCMVGTMAKYVTTGNFNDDARIAKWGLNIPGSTEPIGLFSSEYKGIPPYDQSNTVESADGDNVVAPGTDQSVAVTFAEVTGHAPETMYHFNVKLDASGDLSTIKALDKVKGFNWFLITPTGKRTDCPTYGDLVAAVEGMSRFHVAPNTLPDSISDGGAPAQDDFQVYKAVIGWKWDFYNSDADDIEDTDLGNKAAQDALKAFTVSLSAEAYQIVGGPVPTVDMTGKITYKGVGVYNASVQFVANATNKKSGIAYTDKDGNYTIRDIDKGSVGTLYVVYPGGDPDSPIVYENVSAWDWPTEIEVKTFNVDAAWNDGGSVVPESINDIPQNLLYAVTGNKIIFADDFGELVANPDENYKFKKWVDDNGQTIPDGVYTLSDNTTFNAVFGLPTDLTWYAEGLSYDSKAVTSINWKEGVSQQGEINLNCSGANIWRHGQEDPAYVRFAAGVKAQLDYTVDPGDVLTIVTIDDKAGKISVDGNEMTCVGNTFKYKFDKETVKPTISFDTGTNKVAYIAAYGKEPVYHDVTLATDASGKIMDGSVVYVDIDSSVDINYEKWSTVYVNDANITIPDGNNTKTLTAVPLNTKTQKFDKWVDANGNEIKNGVYAVTKAMTFKATFIDKPTEIIWHAEGVGDDQAAISSFTWKDGVGQEGEETITCGGGNMWRHGSRVPANVNFSQSATAKINYTADAGDVLIVESIDDRPSNIKVNGVEVRPQGKVFKYWFDEETEDPVISFISSGNNINNIGLYKNIDPSSYDITFATDVNGKIMDGDTVYVGPDSSVDNEYIENTPYDINDNTLTITDENGDTKVLTATAVDASKYEFDSWRDADDNVIDDGAYALGSNITIKATFKEIPSEIEWRAEGVPEQIPYVDSFIWKNDIAQTGEETISCSGRIWLHGSSDPARVRFAGNATATINYAAEAGDVLVVKAVNSVSYNIKVNGVEVKPLGKTFKYVFTERSESPVISFMGTLDVNNVGLYKDYQPKTHDVTFATDANGQITKDGDVYVDTDSSVVANYEEGTPYGVEDDTLTIATEEGSSILIATPKDASYRFVAWKDANDQIIPDGNYEVNSNITIKATFEKIPTYDITFATDANGRIMNDTEVFVDVDSSKVVTYKDGTEYGIDGDQLDIDTDEGLFIFNATPKDASYRFVGWVDADGQTIVDGDYDLKSNTTIKATFELIPIYNVTLATDASGKIMDGDNIYVGTDSSRVDQYADGIRYNIADDKLTIIEEEGSKVLTAKPDDDASSQFDAWKDADGKVIPNGDYTISGDLTIKATFVEKPPVTPIVWYAKNVGTTSGKPHSWKDGEAGTGNNIIFSHNQSSPESGTGIFPHGKDEPPYIRYNNGTESHIQLGVGAGSKLTIELKSGTTANPITIDGDTVSESQGVFTYIFTRDVQNPWIVWGGQTNVSKITLLNTASEEVNDAPFFEKVFTGFKEMWDNINPFKAQ